MALQWHLQPCQQRTGADGSTWVGTGCQLGYKIYSRLRYKCYGDVALKTVASIDGPAAAAPLHEAYVDVASGGNYTIRGLRAYVRRDGHSRERRN